MRRIVNQIDAKKEANAFVNDLQVYLQEPGGCMDFFGSNFQPNNDAQSPFQGNASLTAPSQGQALSHVSLSSGDLHPGDDIPNFNLRLVDFKIYGNPGPGRQLANTGPLEDFQLVGYFAPKSVSLEKGLYPIKIGTFSFPSQASVKNCFWRE